MLTVVSWGDVGRVEADVEMALVAVESDNNEQTKGISLPFTLGAFFLFRF